MNSKTGKPLKNDPADRPETGKTLLLAAGLAIAAALLTILFVRFFNLRKTGSTASVPEIPFHSETAMDIWFLDAGSGDSTLIRTPGEEWILIDCGDQSCSDSLPRFLGDKGIRTISKLILTYDDPHRTGGLRAILSRFDVDTICFGSDLSRTTEDLIAEYRFDREIGIMKLSASIKPMISMEPGIDIFVLSPLDAAYPEPGEASTVLRIRYGSNAVLFNSEADPLSEKLIVKAFPNRLLRADVIKLGLNLSGEQITDKYLNAVKPSLAIVPFHSPDNIDLKKLEKRGVQIQPIIEKGTVHIQLDGNSFRVVEY